jgi:hypothetical protein
VKVFPNWVANRDASFARLREKGAFLFTSSYDADTQSVEFVKVKSEAGKKLTLASPWAKGVKVVDLDGNVVKTKKGAAPNHATEITYTFDTVAGMTYTITEAATDTAALSNAYDDATALVATIGAGKANYTTGTWNALEDALDAAEAILGYGADVQADVDAAVTALNAAVNGLAFHATSAYLTMLQITVNGTDQFYAVKDRYTADSWAAYDAIVDAAKDILASPADYTNAEAFAAAQAVAAADKDLVVRPVDKTELIDIVALTDEWLASDEALATIPLSIENLTAALAAAKAAIADANATQDEVDGALDELLSALTQRYQKANKELLDMFTGVLAGYTAGNYTPASWSEFEAALEDALEIAGDANSLQGAVDAAFDALLNAFGGLDVKANYASLNASITVADGIVANAANYAPASLAGHDDAIADANTSHADE